MRMDKIVTMTVNKRTLFVKLNVELFKLISNSYYPNRENRTAPHHTANICVVCFGFSQPFQTQWIVIYYKVHVRFGAPNG